jgi:hypothetical protein
MSDVTLSSSGPPSVVLPLEPLDVQQRLGALDSIGPDVRRAAAAAIVADHPRSLAAWAALGDLGRDDVERYAAYRVGYHRGLDALRANGWRGSGYVRWQHETNRGFLRALIGLGAMAAAIGEHDEAERIELFLGQLDPSGDWRSG